MRGGHIPAELREDAQLLDAEQCRTSVNSAAGTAAAHHIHHALAVGHVAPLAAEVERQRSLEQAAVSLAG